MRAAGAVPAVRALCAAGLCTLALAMGGCSMRLPTAYSPPLQQGNVIEQEALSKLKPGMTRSQVRFVLGTPLVVDVFRNDRWDYVYLLRRQGETPQQRRVTVIFDGDLLARVEGDVVPGAGTVPPPAAAKVDTGRKAAAPGDPAKGNPAKGDAAKGDAAKGEAAKGDAAKGDAATGAAEPQRGFFGRMLDRIGF